MSLENGTCETLRAGCSPGQPAAHRLCVPEQPAWQAQSAAARAHAPHAAQPSRD